MAAGAGQLPPNSILTVVGASFLPLAALAACVQDLTTGQKVFLDPSFNLSTYQPGAPPPGLAGCSTAATAGTAFYNAAAPTAASPANPQTQSQVWAVRWLSALPRGTQFTTRRCCVAACTSTAFVCAPVRLLQVTMSENSDGQKSSEQATAGTGNGGAGGNGSSGNGYSMAVAGSGDGLPAPGQATLAKEGSGGAVNANGSSGQSGRVRTPQRVLLSLNDRWWDPWPTAAAACAQELIRPRAPLCCRLKLARQMSSLPSRGIATSTTITTTITTTTTAAHRTAAGAMAAAGMRAAPTAAAGAAAMMAQVRQPARSCVQGRAIY